MKVYAFHAYAIGSPEQSAESFLVIPDLITLTVSEVPVHVSDSTGESIASETLDIIIPMATEYCSIHNLEPIRIDGRVRVLAL